MLHSSLFYKELSLKKKGGGGCRSLYIIFLIYFMKYFEKFELDCFSCFFDNYAYKRYIFRIF